MLQIIGQSLLIASRMDRETPAIERPATPAVAPKGTLRSFAAQIAASRKAWRAR